MQYYIKQLNLKLRNDFCFVFKGSLITTLSYFSGNVFMRWEKCLILVKGI